MEELFQWFYDQSFVVWCAISLAGNILVFAGSVAACQWLGDRFATRPLFDVPQPFRRSDALLAVLAVLLNAAVGIVGWVLWHAGWITVTFPAAWRVVLDTLLLVLLMDIGMYVFHRVAHHPVIFRIVHRTHHEHESTNPMSLFVLNPLEVAGFGALLIAYLVLLPLSGVAILAYLGINIAFGTLGHAGVEPFPAAWMRSDLTRQIGTSTFHGQHHADPRYNFGFYTTTWDRLFGTLNPAYDGVVTSGTVASASST